MYHYIVPTTGSVIPAGRVAASPESIATADAVAMRDPWRGRGLMDSGLARKSARPGMTLHTMHDEPTWRP
jgi:hypothetical protein